MTREEKEKLQHITRELFFMLKELAEFCELRPKTKAAKSEPVERYQPPPDPRVVEAKFKALTGENTTAFKQIQEPLNELSRNGYVRDAEPLNKRPAETHD